MQRFVVVFTFAGLVCCAAAATAQDDLVFDVKGKPTKGRVTAITQEKVTLQAAGGSRQFDIKEVSRITFGADPRELASARPQIVEGRYADALSELKKIDLAKVSETFVKQDIGYYVALCQAKLALNAGEDKAAAIATLKAFLGQNRESYHFYDGVELLGDLNVAAGDFAQATVFYGLLAKAPWPDYQMRAEIQLANAKCAGGNYAEALPMYEKLLTSGLSTPETVQQVLFASVGKAVCLAETGKPEEGLKLMTELIAKNDSSETRLFGRAYNALGRCYLKLNKPKDAVLAYLHTDLLYTRDAERACRIAILSEQAVGADPQSGPGRPGPQQAPHQLRRQPVGGEKIVLLYVQPYGRLESSSERSVRPDGRAGRHAAGSSLRLRRRP